MPRHGEARSVLRVSTLASSVIHKPTYCAFLLAALSACVYALMADKRTCMDACVCVCVCVYHSQTAKISPLRSAGEQARPPPLHTTSSSHSNLRAVVQHRKGPRRCDSTPTHPHTSTCCGAVVWGRARFSSGVCSPHVRVCVRVCVCVYVSQVLELTCFQGEPHEVPEAVMRHAYTGVLPDSPNLLAWVSVTHTHTHTHKPADTSAVPSGRRISGEALNTGLLNHAHCLHG